MGFSFAIPLSLHSSSETESHPVHGQSAPPDLGWYYYFHPWPGEGLTSDQGAMDWMGAIRFFGET